MAESNNSKSDYSSSVTIKSTSPTTTRRRRRWKNMDKKIRSELTSQDIRDLRDVFDAFDREQHGFISILDLRKALRVLGFRIKRNDVYEIARDVGIERLGDVSFSEMLEVIISMQGDSRDEYEEISQGFKMLDTEKKGHLSADDLLKAAETVEIKLTNRMAQDMVYEADQDGDGFICLNEFIDVMRQTNLYN
ncbi:uncharacterized protein [Apostichopus japonicus]|uniref:uncharacterized protein isoform X1 n=1 Tax=Stichopus japonicus TaxID=307972 RepID=UPI003AB2E9CD